jgi:hypothetical protein
LAKAWPIVFVASNKPIMTCLGYQSLLKKLITNANASQAPLNIQRSKLMLHNDILLRHEQHIIDLFSSLTLIICLVKIDFWKGSLILDKDGESNV